MQTVERQNEELATLKAAIDQAIGVSITDTSGCITYSNELFARASGYRPDEIQGKNHRVFNSHLHPPEFFADLWKTVLAGKIWKGEIRDRRKDGSLFWVRTTIVPFMDSRGHPYQFMSFREDITARKEAEAAIELERAKSRFAERLAAVGEAAANIAHEIANPLATISLNAQVLRHESDRNALTHARVVRATDVIAKTLTRIQAIIRNIRALARDGTADPLEQAKVTEIIRDTLDLCRGSFSSQGIQIEVGVVPEDLEVECRPVQISQVILNLINNACDAVKELNDPQNRWVKLEVQPLPDAILIRVIDAGKGVPKKIREHIMEPLFTTKGRDKGTGLGLSVSKKIAEEHHGTLSLLENAPNTTFELRIPRATSHSVEPSFSM